MHFCSSLLMYFHSGSDTQHLASLISGKSVNLDCGNERSYGRLSTTERRGCDLQSRTVTLMNSSRPGKNSDKADAV